MPGYKLILLVAAVAGCAANGALYGGTRSGLGADRDQQRVVKNCLRGRGNRVLN